MKSLIKELLKATRRKVAMLSNSLGSKKKCYICNRTFYYFTKFGNGSQGMPEFSKRLNIVGSDIDNFGCMYCGSNDRERHLFMFFDKLGLWEKMKGAKILHFAPEKNLPSKICEQYPLEYIKADLCPKNEDVKNIDATAIPFNDVTFDFIIANHILEHISDYSKALYEIFRVLKSGGIAILQTPYSELLRHNFEDDNINTDDLRLFFHGLEDHVRTFGEYQFLRSLEDVGFEIQVKKHEELFDNHMAYYYGVNSRECLIQVVKPACR